MSNAAYFLWVGSELPALARMSVISAAEAGFDVTLFCDRDQDIAHKRLTLSDWSDVDLPWSPNNVRIKGELAPCFAAFSDLFRYAVLARKDGWWFDCDTIVLKPASAFAKLLVPGQITVGFESDSLINGAVLGSKGNTQAKALSDLASAKVPVLDRWGEIGPALITEKIQSKDVSAKVVDPSYFYPIHHSRVATLFQPRFRDELLRQEPDWFCLTLWGEELSRTGLGYLPPPSGSYLDDLLLRNPNLGSLSGDLAGLADFLDQSSEQLGELDSGRAALRTVMRKLVQRVPRRSAR